MDVKQEVRDFLVSRRSRITPEKAGLPAWGRNRRVKGLRREEVALLAGVSVEYYVRLERGNLGGVSDGVLQALANALQLDEAERAHLHDLARTSVAPLRASRPVGRRAVRPPVQWLLDSMGGTAAYVRNARLDLLATERPRPCPLRAGLRDGRASQHGPLRLPRSQGTGVLHEWSKVAGEAAALLRTLAGENPYDRASPNSSVSSPPARELFRTLWATHDVRQHRTGIKKFHHPVVGDLTLAYESMELTADSGLRLNAYVAEPGTPSAEALALLGSWAAPPSHRMKD